MDFLYSAQYAMIQQEIRRKKSFVDILREKNGWCFLIAAATTSNPLFYICEHLSNPKPDWSSSPSSSSLHHIFYIAAMPSSSPVTVLYCSQRDGRVGLYDPVLLTNIVHNWGDPCGLNPS